MDIPLPTPTAPQNIMAPEGLPSAASMMAPLEAAAVSKEPAAGLREKGGITFHREGTGGQSQPVHKIDPSEMNLQLLAMCRSEYTNILNGLIADRIIEGLIAQYDTSVNESRRPQEVIITYQRVLKEVTQWNNHIVQVETERILGESKALLQNLLAAIYISNLKIMASIRISKGVSYVSLTIPSSESFIHRVYIECARILYQNPLIMHLREASATELFNRSEKLTKVVSAAIEKSVRGMLPVKELLEEYLNPDVFNGAVIGLDDPRVMQKQNMYAPPPVQAPQPFPVQLAPEPPVFAPMPPVNNMPPPPQLTPLPTFPEPQPVVPPVLEEPTTLPDESRLPFVKASLEKDAMALPQHLRDIAAPHHQEEFKTIPTHSKGPSQEPSPPSPQDDGLPQDALDEDFTDDEGEDDDDFSEDGFSDDEGPRSIAVSLFGGLASAGLAYAWVTYCDSGRKFSERFEDPYRVYIVAAVIGAAIGYLVAPTSGTSAEALPMMQPLAAAEAHSAGTLDEGAGGKGEAAAEVHDQDPQAYSGDHLDTLNEPFM